jgi:phosphoribosylpyrophosphate synthetase
MTLLLANAEPKHLWTDIVAVRVYYPYWLAGRERNPKFRREDGLVLDLKDNLDGGVKTAVQDFRKALQAFGLPSKTRRVRLAVVPGHEARPSNEGRALSRVVAALVEESAGGFLDGSGLLLRHATIDKLAKGGDRDVSIHLKSVGLAGKVRDETLVVLDDVTTSGGSLVACRQLLRKAGAARIGALALGLTTHQTQNSHSS